MMKPIAGRLVAAAATNGLIATLMGALGAHALGDAFVPAAKGWINTGVEMQIAASIGLLGAAMLGEHGRKKWAHYAAVTLGLGVVAFSGSLYALALTNGEGLRGFHWITPVGGMLLMLGWGTLAIGALRSSRGFNG